MNIEEYKGLTNAEVNKRIAEGKINNTQDTITKSTKQIFLSNIITFFNVINFILFILIISVHSYHNSLFIFLLIINTGIGIYQELKAKRILDKLSILGDTPAKVIRNSKIIEIDKKDIVEDDYLLLQSGDQIPADALILDGEVEVNESLLTGESDAITKNKDSKIFAGSYITAGECIAKVTEVGHNAYMYTILKEVKKLKRAKSELFTSINKVLKVVSFIIIPVGILLFIKEFYISGASYADSILKMAAALLGMVPQGLVLLTTMALTLSVIRLSKRKTLVQELYCIEMLARVDTLCLDKTGTITEGRMRVETVDLLTKEDIASPMGSIIHNETNFNTTLLAIKDYFKENQDQELIKKIPFSSERKYSAYTFASGTYYLGAKEFLFPNGKKSLDKLTTTYEENGYRVLIVAYSKGKPKKDEILPNLKPLAIITLSDIIRSDASKTFAYFKTQKVNLKIISGDNPLTVSRLAKRAGFKNADNYIDAGTLDTEDKLKEAVSKYNIFGRVTPMQKKQMIIALKEQGHTVAMVGDGVNDCLALKEADCSIAMASGSDAAKRTANLILFNNDFSSMPHIVNEGRRVINNITYSASLFLIKTLFSSMMAIFTILIGKTYPFLPIQLSVMTTFCVAIPTFFLTYEPNFNPVNNNFLSTVFRNAFPYAFTISILSVLIMTVGVNFGHSAEMLSTICIFLSGWNYMKALETIYSPLSKYRMFIIYTCEILYFVAMFVLKDFLELTDVTYAGLVILLFCSNFLPLFHSACRFLYNGCAKLFQKAWAATNPL